MSVRYIYAISGDCVTVSLCVRVRVRARVNEDFFHVQSRQSRRKKDIEKQKKCHALSLALAMLAPHEILCGFVTVCCVVTDCVTIMAVWLDVNVAV